MQELKKELNCWKMPDFVSNEGQQAAITFTSGAMLVLAGPGSGKTFVITHRIQYLISKCHIPPSQILVLTFTKAASVEMQTRAQQLLKQCNYVQFGTFHSVFYQILRKSYPNENIHIVTEKERTQFVHAMLTNPTDDTVESCLKEISQRKNSMTNVFQMSCDEYERVYQEYETWLMENKKLDFDDMVTKCYQYLTNCKEARALWQIRFSYILIDEFQDINSLQYETIKLLCGNGNLFVVGDDDQAIYGFRGSNPAVMRQFVEEYKAKVVRLLHNYRSRKKLVKIASDFIGHNQNRFTKNIVAVNEQNGEVVLKGFQDRQEEAAFVFEEIQKYAEANPGKKQAVLLRTNGLCELYLASIGEQKENPIWKDIKAYLNFINQGGKRKDFLQIMNKPNRYISRNLITEEVVDFSKLQARLQNKPWIQKRVLELEKKIVFARKLDLRGQLHYIWKSLGYDEYVRETNNGNVEKIKEASKHYTKLLSLVENGFDYDMLVAAMDRVQQDIHKGWKEAISIMTYHGAKGLEFDRVYLPDLNYGKVPHGRMLYIDELEEERRMFYVAMTRAKESLVLLYVNSQKGSPFLDEIYENYSSSDWSISSSNSQLSKYSSKASSTFSNSASSSM